MLYYIGPSTSGAPITWYAEQRGQAWRGSNLSVDDIMEIHGIGTNTVVNYQRVRFVKKLQHWSLPEAIESDSYMMRHGYYIVTGRANDWAYNVKTWCGNYVLPLLHVHTAYLKDSTTLRCLRESS